MRNLDVLIIIDNKNRELESALFLKRILEERGYSCGICSDGWSIASYRFKYKAKVIVTPWCYDEENLTLMRCFKSARDDKTISIVNEHCEQLVSSDNHDFYMPKGEVKNIYHCSWGPYYTKVLKEAGVSDSLICETGATKLDFFRNEFADTQKEQLGSRFGLDCNKKWVLFVGNFSGAFIGEEQAKNLEGRGFSIGEDSKERAAKAYEITLSWMSEVAQSVRGNGVEIIYRPHPTEPITDKLKTVEQENQNVTVVKELSIREWFQTCDIAFVWSSTSSVEAVAAGIPVVSLEPIKIPKNEAIEIVGKLDKLHNPSEIQDVIAKLLHGETIQTSPAFVEDVKNYYRMGGELATVLTADLVEKAINDKSGQFKSEFRFAWSVSILIKYFIKLFLLKIGILGQIPHFKTIVDNKMTKKDYENACSVVDHYFHTSAH